MGDLCVCAYIERRFVHIAQENERIIEGTVECWGEIGHAKIKKTDIIPLQPLSGLADRSGAHPKVILR